MARQALQRAGERRQRGGDRGSRGMVAKHRGDVLRPHLLVLGLGRGDCRGILAEEVRPHEPHQRRTVGCDQRRMHHLGAHRLVDVDCNFRVSGRLLGLGRSRLQPRHIGRRRGRHCRRGRTLPRPVHQTRGHRPERVRRYAQLRRQPVPGRRRLQHRARAGAGEDLRGIDLRWQYQEIHAAVLRQAVFPRAPVRTGAVGLPRPSPNRIPTGRDAHRMVNRGP